MDYSLCEECSDLVSNWSSGQTSRVGMNIHCLHKFDDIIVFISNSIAQRSSFHRQQYRGGGHAFAINDLL